MTKALDAAIEAAQERYDAGDDDDIAIAAAFGAALPAEPPPEIIEAMSKASYERSFGAVWPEGGLDYWRDDERASYLALRAYLLGEGA